MRICGGSDSPARFFMPGNVVPGSIVRETLCRETLSGPHCPEIIVREPPSEFTLSGIHCPGTPSEFTLSGNYRPGHIVGDTSSGNHRPGRTVRAHNSGMWPFRKGAVSRVRRAWPHTSRTVGGGVSFCGYRRPVGPENESADLNKKVRRFSPARSDFFLPVIANRTRFALRSRFHRRFR